MTARTFVGCTIVILLSNSSLGQEQTGHSIHLGVGQKKLAETVSPHYWDRQYLLKRRWENAIAIRREYNAAKGPARGWLAIRVPYNPLALPDPVGQQQELLRRHRERMRPVRYSWSDFYLDMNRWLAESSNY
jgi:hypothetical protein